MNYSRTTEPFGREILLKFQGNFPGEMFGSGLIFIFRFDVLFFFVSLKEKQINKIIDTKSYSPFFSRKKSICGVIVAQLFLVFGRKKMVLSEISVESAVQS